MFVIQLVLAIVVLGAIILGISKFNQHCAGRFGHMFFTKTAFYLTATALAFVIAGALWRESAAQHHGDQLNGIALMIIGGLIGCGMIYTNVKRTNFSYGVGGSVVQLGMFSVLAWISVPLIILALVGQFVLLNATPVYIVNK